MKVFQFAGENFAENVPFCRFDHDVLQFDGADYAVASCAEAGQYQLLDSAVSGGSFQQFLQYAMVRYDGRVCLYLRQTCTRFSLPCCDGLGEEADPSEACGGIYSPLLAENIALRDGYAYVYDDCHSLREKYRIAEEVGIPLLIADSGVLQTKKAP